MQNDCTLLLPYDGFLPSSDRSVRRTSAIPRRNFDGALEHSCAASDPGPLVLEIGRLDVGSCAVPGDPDRTARRRCLHGQWFWRLGVSAT